MKSTELEVLASIFMRRMNMEVCSTPQNKTTRLDSFPGCPPFGFPSSTMDVTPPCPRLKTQIMLSCLPEGPDSSQKEGLVGSLLLSKVGL